LLFSITERVDSEDALLRGEKARGSHHKFKHGKFKLDIMKKFFTMRVVVREVPREVVGSPSLEIFNTQLHNALSNPSQV